MSNTGDTKNVNLEGFVDLTRGKGEVRNYYNPKTKSHYYKGRFWSKEEWYQWINDCEDKKYIKNL